jgi:hypothetical protein
MAKTKKTKVARFANGTVVFLRKYYEGYPKNHELQVVDNEKKNVKHKKHSILVQDPITEIEFRVETKYLDQ